MDYIIMYHHNFNRFVTYLSAMLKNCVTHKKRTQCIFFCFQVSAVKIVNNKSP